ncbi:MAG: protein kinase [Nitrospirae bacterium]|nr:protein kinase [Nitrospirota bacterium]
MAKLFSDKYEIIEEIASGGMGVLYKANQLNLNRVVALKVLHTQFTSDPSFLKRFDREARAMARLDHQNIIRVYDVGQHENSHYIVMEYFPGKDLRWMTVEKGSFAPQETVEIAIQIAEALSFAHENGIIHRDIKPGNIMISDRKIIKVGDFGIAAAADEVSLTSTGQVLGTPEYMAPEQAKGEPIDGRADLYALGLVMYKMLTGSSPYEGLSKMAIVGKLIYEKEDSTLIYKQPVSNQLQQIILKLIKKDASLRYPNARALIDDLHELRESLMLEAAQQKLRHKGGAAEATAALETNAVPKESVTPFPPMSASPVPSGEPTAALKRSPETASAMTSGPTIVTAAPKSKQPMMIVIGIGAAVLAGVLIVYGLWPAHQESSTSVPATPPPSVSAPMEQTNRNGANTSTPPAVQNPSTPAPQKEAPSVQARTERPPQKPTTDKKPSEKKPAVAVLNRETETARSTAAPPSPAPQKETATKETAPKETAVVPPQVQTPPRRLPEEIEKEKILEVVKRQENAFESKDVDLYMADLANADARQRKEISRVFEQYAKINVVFEVQEINLSGDSAALKMIQNTRLVFKNLRPEQSTKTKVLWELSKAENKWKIRNTKILEKIQ